MGTGQLDAQAPAVLVELMNVRGASHPQTGDIKKELNIFAADGWELVSTASDVHRQGNDHPVTTQMYLILKRPKQ